MDIRYLNVDLDIESNEDLSALVEDLGEDVFVLHHGLAKGLNHASFSLTYALYSGPDEAITGFCRLIQNLSPQARSIWDGCFSRVFDLGFECGKSPTRFYFELRPSTIRMVADIGASVAMTIYPMSSAAE